MKRLTFVLLTALLFVHYSCSEQPSKAVQALEKGIKDIEAQIQKTDDCDDLQLLTFSILGLRTDLEKIQQQENLAEEQSLALTETIDQLDASLTGKYVSLDCSQTIEDKSEIDTYGEGEDEYDE